MSQRQESSVILWKCVLVRDYVGNTFYNFLPIHWTDLFYFRLPAIYVYVYYIVKNWAIWYVGIFKLYKTGMLNSVK